MATSMKAPPGEPSLSKEQHRALTLLARIPQGITKNTLTLAWGFDGTMVAGLVDAGLVTARREVVTAPSRTTGDPHQDQKCGRRVIEGWCCSTRGARSHRPRKRGSLTIGQNPPSHLKAAKSFASVLQARP
jgi:hypothetical protein